jgi:hypothetical protein
MKTFDEAFSAVIEVKPGPPLVAEVVDGEIERSRELTAEIGGDEVKFQAIHFIAHHSCCLRHALLNVFQLGLRVGQEMERSETGGVIVE